MTSCLFASDLHGRLERFEKLLQRMEDQRPSAVFLGGDLLPSGLAPRDSHRSTPRDFVSDYLVGAFGALRDRLMERYPRVFLILGNDDPRSEEAAFIEAAERGLWDYVHGVSQSFGDFTVYGYSYVPPTPFTLKDWERYDVSRYVDPGCVPPEEGRFSYRVSEHELQWSTIRDDLEKLVAPGSLDKTILLFHAPPYKTNLDRAALDGKKIDHVPLDVHVGSIAIERFIRERQPLLTLHGHVHESTRLTGAWCDRLGATHAFNGAHDGPELAVISFRPEDPGSATRELL